VGWRNTGSVAAIALQVVAIFVCLAPGCGSNEERIVGKWSGRFELSCPGLSAEVKSLPVELELDRNGRSVTVLDTLDPLVDSYTIKGDQFCSGDGREPECVQIDELSNDSLVLTFTNSMGCLTQFRLARK
jgi:hypothetical protein